MIGNNELKLNQATINTAIEYYLNEVVFETNKQVTVTSVTEQNVSGTFIVKISPKEKQDGTM